MTSKKWNRDEVLGMLFADSDSEGEFLPHEEDDDRTNASASHGETSEGNGADMRSEDVTQAPTHSHTHSVSLFEINGVGSSGERGCSVHRGIG